MRFYSVVVSLMCMIFLLSCSFASVEQNNSQQIDHEAELQLYLENSTIPESYAVNHTVSHSRRGSSSKESYFVIDNSEIISYRIVSRDISPVSTYPSRYCTWSWNIGGRECSCESIQNGVRENTSCEDADPDSLIRIPNMISIIKTRMLYWQNITRYDVNCFSALNKTTGLPLQHIDMCFENGTLSNYSTLSKVTFEIWQETWRRTR